jgi:hypothetical protein
VVARARWERARRRGAILAEAARRSIPEQIGSELQAHAPQLEEGDGQRALPAPNDDQDPRDRAEDTMGQGE